MTKEKEQKIFHIIKYKSCLINIPLSEALAFIVTRKNSFWEKCPWKIVSQQLPKQAPRALRSSESKVFGGFQS
jgi:hypothetical protein